MDRINPAIGHMKLSNIRPQQLNSLYMKHGEPGASKLGDKSTICVDLYALMASREMKRTALTALPELAH